jgi:hypothetical protein
MSQTHKNTQAHTQNTNPQTQTHTHTHTPSFNLRKIWDIKVTIKEVEVVRAQCHAILISARNGNG